MKVLIKIEASAIGEDGNTASAHPVEIEIKEEIASYIDFHNFATTIRDLYNEAVIKLHSQKGKKGTT